MVFRTLLTVSAVFILSGCAQVGYLTGGEEDVIAPEPIQAFPTNGSTSFNSKEVKLSFNEFVQLKDPQQNIFLVPNDAKINAKLNKKILALQWEEDLNANTTYVIYLNNTVVDASEGNSTLFSYVFSTGAVLDTLARTFRVKNISTNSVAPKTTVGLFTNKDSLKPLYFSVSDNSGIAQFRYLKEGKYAVRAFQDENKDLMIGSLEVCGFLTDSITVSPQVSDTLEIQLFPPLPKRSINRFEFKAPGIFEIELVHPAQNPVFLFNNQALDSTRIRVVTERIYRLLPINSIPQNNKIYLMAENTADSASLRISAKERIAPLTVDLTNTNLLASGQPILFQVNAEIQMVDTSKIQFYSLEDTLHSIPFRFEYSKDMFYVWFASAQSGSYRIELREGAINGVSKKFDATVEIKAKRDLGTVELKPEGFDGPLIIELFKESKVVSSRKLPNNKTALFEDLIPGDYTFKIIEDRNGNGSWDTGELHKKIQPERIHIYSSPVRVRPNWDVKLTLKAEK